MSRGLIILWTALALSLLGNAYLGGLVAGRDLLGGPPRGGHHRPEPHRFPFGADRAKDLSAEGRAHVETVWEQVRPKLRAEIRESWKTRRAVRELLRADPFDRAAYEAANQAQDDAHRDSRALIETALADIAEGLSAQDRAIYFAPREKSRRFGKPGDDRGGPPDGSPGGPPEP